MLRASGVHIPENNLDNLKLTREEDGEFETVDPKCLLGSEMLVGLDLKILVSLLKSTDFATLVFLSNRGVIFEDMLKGAYFGAKTKTFEDYPIQTNTPYPGKEIRSTDTPYPPGAASRWLRNEPSGSITNWETLKMKFLNKYCPHAYTAKKMREINNFQQELDESLFRAWERFKELLMKCPLHYLTDMQEVILFYNGLDVPTRQILDSKGAIPTKIDADAKIAIQEMA
ncbi:hypothetical protein Tco_1531645 [Tanacetum coccineum]